MEREKSDARFDGKEMLAMMGRVEALIGYVRHSRYSIERETIAAILGFELENPKDEN